MSQTTGKAPFALKLTEQGEVVIIVGADRINLGRQEEVCEELCRFLTEVDYGETGQGDGTGQKIDRIEEVVGEAYQVVGALASMAGAIEDPAVIRALDILADPEGCPGSMLPFVPEEG